MIECYSKNCKYHEYNKYGKMSAPYCLLDACAMEQIELLEEELKDESN